MLEVERRDAGEKLSAPCCLQSWRGSLLCVLACVCACLTLGAVHPLFSLLSSGISIYPPGVRPNSTMPLEDEPCPVCRCVSCDCVQSDECRVRMYL